MLIKLIGSVVVILSFYGFGWYMAECTKKRREEMLGFKKAFLLFSGETMYAGGALWEIFENIGKRCAGRAGQAFLKASELLYGKGAGGAFAAWEEAVDKSIDGSFMIAEDIDNIKAFGRCLGFSDEMSQLNNADLTVSYIDEKSMELKELYSEQKRLYKSLGIMAGLLIVVVII